MQPKRYRHFSRAVGWLLHTSNLRWLQLPVAWINQMAIMCLLCPRPWLIWWERDREAVWRGPGPGALGELGPEAGGRQKVVWEHTE